jgi:hypothetical protein
LGGRKVDKPLFEQGFFDGIYANEKGTVKNEE